MSITTEIVTAELSGKKWYLSKTIWANILATAAVGIQLKFGFFIPAEFQLIILSAVNAVLRKISKEEIVW